MGLALHSGVRSLGSLASELLSGSHDETDDKSHSREKVFALGHSGRGQPTMVGKLEVSGHKASKSSREHWILYWEELEITFLLFCLFKK